MLDLVSSIYIFPNNFGIFSIYGFIFLLYNAIRDFKTGYIDERFNTFMGGVILTLYSIEGISGRLILNAIFTAFLIWVFGKFGGFEQGDLSAFSWLFLGYLLWSPFFLLIFLFLLTFIGVIASISMKRLYKTEKYPFYPFILLAFGLANFFIASVLLIS
ncbi:MAG: hypothetical protein V3U92_19630 [Cellulophaga sp.]